MVDNVLAQVGVRQTDFAGSCRGSRGRPNPVFEHYRPRCRESPTRDNARRKPLPVLRINRDLFGYEKTIREVTQLVVLFRKRKSVHRNQPSYVNVSRDVFGVKDHPTWGCGVGVWSGMDLTVLHFANFCNLAGC